MMSADLHIALSFALTEGVRMLLGYRVVRLARRGRRRGGDGNVEPKVPHAPLPGDDGSLPPLPPSLVEAAKGRPVRPKVPEPA